MIFFDEFPFKHRDLTCYFHDVGLIDAIRLFRRFMFKQAVRRQFRMKPIVKWYERHLGSTKTGIMRNGTISGVYHHYRKVKVMAIILCSSPKWEYFPFYFGVEVTYNNEDID